jgi:hypothetical protein
MAKTRAQWARPAAKGKHQRSGQRVNPLRYPPSGQEWGQKNWTGTGGGVAVPYGLLLFETQTVVSPSSGALRLNNASPALATIVYASETYQPGSIGDPIATLIVGDPLRIYNANDTRQWFDYTISAVADSGAYRAYTVTYVATHGGFAPVAGTLLGISERAATSPREPGDDLFDPGDMTIDEVKAEINAWAMDDERAGKIQTILDRERAGKNRSTLVTWLDQQLGVV